MIYKIVDTNNAGNKRNNLCIIKFIDLIFSSEIGITKPEIKKNIPTPTAPILLLKFGNKKKLNGRMFNLLISA